MKLTATDAAGKVVAEWQFDTATPDGVGMKWEPVFDPDGVTRVASRVTAQGVFTVPNAAPMPPMPPAG